MFRCRQAEKRAARLGEMDASSFDSEYRFGAPLGIEFRTKFKPCDYIRGAVDRSFPQILEFRASSMSCEDVPELRRILVSFGKPTPGQHFVWTKFAVTQVVGVFLGVFI